MSSNVSALYPDCSIEKLVNFMEHNEKACVTQGSCTLTINRNQEEITPLFQSLCKGNPDLDNIVLAKKAIILCIAAEGNSYTTAKKVAELLINKSDVRGVILDFTNISDARPCYEWIYSEKKS